MSQLIMNAAHFAAQAHKHQMRLKMNVPYINHPIQVAAFAAECRLDEYCIAVALLHDCIEDVEGVTLETIEEAFGVGIAYAVTLLTKWWGDDAKPEDKDYPEYYRRICTDHDIMCIKILDRAANLHDMVFSAKSGIKDDVKRANRYMKKTTEQILPLVAKCKNDKVINIFNNAFSELNKALNAELDRMLDKGETWNAD